MEKNYFLTSFLALACFIATHSGFAQDMANRNPMQQTIEHLSIYPNPVSNGKAYIYITSKHNMTKKVEFYDVLGKLIYKTTLIGKELNISNFNKGVYILKITENTVSETRKLVIK